MSQLREANLKKCVSLLQDFIDGSMDSEDKKGMAGLALQQLQMITAGHKKEKSEDDINPYIDNTMMEGGPKCITTPMADPNPGG